MLILFSFCVTLAAVLLLMNFLLSLGDPNTPLGNERYAWRIISILIPILLIILIICMPNIREEEARSLLLKGHLSMEAYYQDHKDGTRTIEYRWINRNNQDNPSY